MNSRNPSGHQLAALRRLRWAVRATLVVGVAASVAANVLHAQAELIAQLFAGWPPCALLLTVELVSRVPVHGRLLGAVRIATTVVIAGIAAWVSYWHMADVAGRYGESDTSAHLLPVSVDGLIVVASICLVELAGRIRDIEVVGHDDPSIVDAPRDDEPQVSSGLAMLAHEAISQGPVISAHADSVSAQSQDGRPSNGGIGEASTRPGAPARSGITTTGELTR